MNMPTITSGSVAVPSADGLAVRSRSDGFFAHHGLWAPGVRLLRRLRFRSKALLIAAAFLLPIGWLGWNYFTTQSDLIAFSAKERLGVTFAQETAPVLELLQRRRRAVLSGEPVPVADLEAAVRRLAAREAALRADLSTGDDWARWGEAMKAAAAAGAGSPAADVLAAHGQAIDRLLALLGTATDQSNLTLDPDIDTYYLMDAAMFRLPPMQEAVARMQAVGGVMTAAGQGTAAQRRALIEQMTVLRGHADALRAGLDKAVAYNAALARGLPSQAAHAAVKQLAELVDAQLLQGEQLPGGGPALAAAASQAGAALAALTQQATAALDTLVAARVARLERARNLTAAVLLAGLLAAAYFFMAFRKVLDGGLREVALHLDAMRDGNLTTRPRPWGRDEIALLMDNLSQMQQSLRRIVNQVRTATEGFVVASTQIAGGALDLNARTEQSAANLEETASAMEEIASTVRNSAETMEEAARLAGHSAGAAETGGRIIGEVVETMQAINVSSGRIGDIIGTIDGIAFQTNILALNAAVEAARAGEQGRGFAVVAAEVRELALRTTDAAREIKQLITVSAGQVENGVKVVRTAGQSVQEIVGAAQRVRELLAAVAVGAREQTQGVAQSAEAVQRLDAVTQQNAALVEQTASAAGSLKDQARALAGEVSQFRLG